jgi:uncharacterized protein (TIGR02246 family)
MTHSATQLFWRRVFTATALSMLLVSCAHVDDTGFLGEIEQLQERIDQAMLANDPVALGRYLRDDVTRTGPGGVTTNRAQWLAQVESAQIRYLSVRRCQTTIRRYHDTAVVTGLVDIEVMKPSTGRELEHNRTLRVYVREDGAWRLAAHQATKAPQGVTCENSTGANSQ